MSARKSANYSCSGTHDGESIGAAIRRHAAWLALAREQLDQSGDMARARIELEGLVTAFATLSLEVDDLEVDALRAVAADEAKAVTT